MRAGEGEGRAKWGQCKGCCAAQHVCNETKTYTAISQAQHTHRLAARCSLELQLHTPGALAAICTSCCTACRPASSVAASMGRPTSAAIVYGSAGGAGM